MRAVNPELLVHAEPSSEHRLGLARVGDRFADSLKKSSCIDLHSDEFTKSDMTRAEIEAAWQRRATVSWTFGSTSMASSLGPRSEENDIEIGLHQRNELPAPISMAPCSIELGTGQHSDLRVSHRAQMMDTKFDGADFSAALPTCHGELRQRASMA
jgi:hypothetical protein